MNTLWLIITFPFWLSDKVWKWFVVYPYLRSIGAHHVQTAKAYVALGAAVVVIFYIGLSKVFA